MPAPTIALALEREHHEIDACIDEFATHLERGDMHPAALLSGLTALERHIYIEEQFLFPPVRDAGLIMPIIVMLDEHGRIWRAMQRLRSGLDGEIDLDGIRSALDELRDLLEQHNRKEEPIVYPQARTALTADQAIELAEVIATGRTPAGWTCLRADD